MYSVSSNKKAVPFALLFIPKEIKEDMIWILEQLIELSEPEDISHPQVFITDRDLALIDALSSLFSTIPKILCR